MAYFVIETPNQRFSFILFGRKIKTKEFNGQLRIILHSRYTTNKSDLSLLLEGERLCIDIKWLTSSQLRLLSKQM